MPEFGPFSLVTLAFLMFSFVAWELGISHKGRLSLAFFAGVLLVVSAGRLLLGHLTMLYGMFSVRETMVGDPALHILDGLILATFVVVLSATASHVITLAATADP